MSVPKKLLENESLISDGIQILDNESNVANFSILISEKNRTEKELKILYEITQAMNESYKPEDIYKTALDNIIDLEYVDHTCIYVVDDDKNEAVMLDHRNMSDDFIDRAGRVPYPKGVTWQVINSGKIVNVSDATTNKVVGPAGKSLGFRSMLGIPIKIEGKIKGVFWFLSDKNHHYTQQIEEFLTSIGNQIATAIARANIYSTLDKKKRYEEIINKISSKVYKSDNVSEIFQIAVDEIKNNVRSVDMVFIYCYEGQYANLECCSENIPEWYVERAGKIPYPKGATWETYIHGRSIYIPDVENSDILGKAGVDLGVKSYLSTPFYLEGKIAGVINISSMITDAFSTDERKLLSIVTNQIEVAISKAKQNEKLNKYAYDLSSKILELEKKYTYEESLTDILLMVGKSNNLSDVMSNAVKAMKKNIPRADNVSIYMVEDNVAVLKQYVGYPDWFIDRVRIIPYPKGLTWKTINNASSYYVDNVDKYDSIGPAGRDVGTKSYVSMPLFYEDSVVGVININSYSEDAFEKEEIDFLEKMKMHLETAINNANKSEKLKESEERYRSLVENTSDLVAEIDLSGNTIFVNRSCCDFLGHSFNEIVGKKFSEYIYHKDVEKFVSNLKKIKKSKSSQYLEFRIKKQEKYSWVQSSIIYAKNLKGENVILLNSKDISDKKKLEEKERRMDKLESLGVLAGGIAHDFNNLISIIMGSISLLDMNLDKKSEKISKYLNDLEYATKRSRDLTNQLLTFSKGGAPIKKVVSTFGDLVKETSEFTTSGSNSTCNINIEEDLWPIEVDTGQMSQVLQNLTINATQAMPNGGNINISVMNEEVTSENYKNIANGKYVKIVIKDEGIGISEEVQEKMFDPYFTTKKGGNGLGLASVYSIIKNHGGHIYVDSEIDVGTTFSIFLPVTDKESTDESESDCLTKADGKVLVMDDDPILRRVISNMLEHMGFNVETAEDGEEVVKKYKSLFSSGKEIALVLLDLTVPGKMGGKEAQAKLLEIDPEIKSLVCSGYSNDTVLANYKEYGFKGMVSKPYNIEELSVEIHRILNT